MEKLTEEEIKIAKKVWDEYSKIFDIQELNSGFREYLGSLLEPERKKVIFKVEIAETSTMELNESSVQVCLTGESHFDRNKIYRVTELPEVFTREEICDIFDPSFTSKDYIDGLINKWLSERNKR